MSGKSATVSGLILLVIAGGILGVSAGLTAGGPTDLRLALALGILALIGFGVALGLRADAPLVMRQILLWAAASLVAGTIIGYRGELSDALGISASPLVGKQTIAKSKNVSGLVALRAEAGGHFFADALVNGTFVRFLVDTGATEVALTHEDAARLGLPVERLDYKIAVRTANGVTEAAHVELDSLVIGTIRLDKVSALITRGALDQSLLGMSFLKRLGSVSVDSDRLIMRQ